MSKCMRSLLPLFMLTALASSRAAAQATLSAESSALAVVPASAPIVIQIHGVERTKERLVALLKKALPDFGAMAAARIDEALKEGLEDRQLKGLEKDGPIFIAFLEIPKIEVAHEPPKVAVIARVRNYAEFRDGILTDDERKSLKKGEGGVEVTQIKSADIYFLDRKDWVVVSPRKDAIEALGKGGPGLDTKIAREPAKRFIDTDAAVYVDLAAINKEFGDEIKQAKEQFFGLMDQFGGQDPATMEMVKKMYGGIFQVIEDGRAFFLAVEFRPEGFNLHLAATIGANTPTNGFLKDQKPSSLSDLAKMPRGQVIYSATEFAPSLLKTMAPLMYGMASDEDAKKAIQAAVEELVGAGSSMSMSAASFPPSGVQVSKFEDTRKAAEAQLKLYRALGEGATFQNAAIKGKPEIREKDKTYKGFTFNYMKFTWDLDKMTAQLPGGGDDAKNAMKKLVGEGIQVWFGTDGKQFLTVTANDWADAQAKIDEYLAGQSTLDREPAFAATRQQLPAEATILGLADAGRFATAMGDYMLGLFRSMPFPFNLPESMKKVETATTFLGFSVVMKPEYGSFDFFVPVTAIQEIRKVILPLFAGGE